MNEGHLKYFGHVYMRVINAPMRNSKLIYVEGTKKGRGIPKITLIKMVKNDMLIQEVTKEMASNIIERKRRIHVNMLIKEVAESMTSNIIKWKKRKCVTDPD